MNRIVEGARSVGFTAFMLGAVALFLSALGMKSDFPSAMLDPWGGISDFILAVPPIGLILWMVWKLDNAGGKV